MFLSLHPYTVGRRGPRQEGAVAAVRAEGFYGNPGELLGLVREAGGQGLSRKVGRITLLRSENAAVFGVDTEEDARKLAVRRCRLTSG